MAVSKALVATTHAVMAGRVAVVTITEPREVRIAVVILIVMRQSFQTVGVTLRALRIGSIAQKLATGRRETAMIGLTRSWNGRRSTGWKLWLWWVLANTVGSAAGAAMVFGSMNVVKAFVPGAGANEDRVF